MLVTIYTGKNCPYCVKAKDILNKIDASVITIKVGEDISKEDFKRNVGLIAGQEITTVPQIIIDGSYVGGYTELAALNLVSEEEDEVDLNELDMDI